MRQLLLLSLKLCVDSQGISYKQAPTLNAHSLCITPEWCLKPARRATGAWHDPLIWKVCAMQIQ